MSGYWTDTASFIDAHLGTGGAVCVALIDDEMAAHNVPFTSVTCLYQGNWLDGGTFKWDTAAVTRCQLPVPQYAIVGVNGQVQFVGSGDMHEERIAEGVLAPPAGTGLVRGARAIEGVLYVCGMKRQVFRREGREQWRCLTAAIPQERGVVGFEAIDGYTHSEIYAVGWEGEVWHFDGTNWNQYDTGTNVILLDVVCAGDGIVYAIGRGRKLVIGRGAQWRTIDLNLSVELSSIAWFEGKLYACSTRDIFVWDGSLFNPLVIEGDRPRTIQYLNSGEGGLCAVGPKDLFRFDGSTWFRID